MERRQPPPDSSSSSSSSSSDNDSGSDDEVASPLRSPSRLVSPARSRGNGLSVPTQRILVRELVLGGGLHNASLGKICKRNTELFGETKTRLRRTVQNKVQFWRRLPQVEYEQIVNSLFATDTAALKQLAALARPNRCPSTQSEQLTMNPSSSFSHVTPSIINVDLDNPWNNGGFNVWTVRDFELDYNKGFVDAFEIELPNTNVRDFGKDNYQARLINKNTVEIRLPILPLAFLQDDNYLGRVITPSTKPRLDLRAAFLANKVQAHRFVHLRFPIDVTNKCFLPAGRTDETLLDVASIPYVGIIEYPEAMIRTAMLRQQTLDTKKWPETRLIWRVACDAEPRMAVMPIARVDGMHAFFASVYSVPSPSAASVPSQMQAVVPFVLPVAPAAPPVAPAPVASSAIAAAPVASSAIAAPTLGPLQLAALLADTDALMVDINYRKRLAAEIGERQNEEGEEEHVSFESPRKRQAQENELVLQHQPDQVWGALPVEDIDVAEEEEEEEKEDDLYDPFDYGVDGDPDM